MASGRLAFDQTVFGYLGFDYLAVRFPPFGIRPNGVQQTENRSNGPATFFSVLMEQEDAIETHSVKWLFFSNVFRSNCKLGQKENPTVPAKWFFSLLKRFSAIWFSPNGFWPFGIRPFGFSIFCHSAKRILAIWLSLISYSDNQLLVKWHFRLNGNQPDGYRQISIRLFGFSFIWHSAKLVSVIWNAAERVSSIWYSAI